MGELGSLLEEALNSQKIKTTKSLWHPISEFDHRNYNYKPMMIAAVDLIDPICNPEGAAFGWYHQEDDVFIVGVGNRGNPSIDNLTISRSDVSHFILVEAPYASGMIPSNEISSLILSDVIVPEDEVEIVSNSTQLSTLEHELNKLRFVVTCPKCGSPDVTADATARWNFETLLWELSTAFDIKQCGSCDYEGKTFWETALSELTDVQRLFINGEVTEYTPPTT